MVRSKLTSCPFMPDDFKGMSSKKWRIGLDYLKKETKSKQEAVKIPECDDMKTCAFLSMLFKKLRGIKLWF